jgi:hypothetical protein
MEGEVLVLQEVGIDYAKQETQKDNAGQKDGNVFAL